MNAPFLCNDPQRQALETIAEIARTALRTPATTGARHGLFDGAAPAAPSAPGSIQGAAGRAKALYAARRRRDRAFGDYADLLADPAWDILLDLFVAHHEARPVCVSSACLAASVAPTTGLRWLVTLERRALVERAPDPEDKRRNFVDLTPAGLALVDQALAQL